MNTEKLKPGTRRILIALIVVTTLLFAYNALHTYVAMEGLAFWGYPYISSFVADADKGIKMKKYQCPLFIGPGESKQVGVSLKNTTDKVVDAYLQTVLTNPGVEYGIQHETKTITIQVGETRFVTWKIDQSNIVKGRFVLTRSFVSWQPQFVSNRSLSCHPLVVNLFGLPSNLVGIGLFVLLGFLTIVFAALFVRRDSFYKHHQRPRSSLVYLLVALTFMTIGSLVGSWLISFLTIVLIILGFLAFWQVGCV